MKNISLRMALVATLLIGVITGIIIGSVVSRINFRIINHAHVLLTVAEALNAKSKDGILTSDDVRATIAALNLHQESVGDIYVNVDKINSKNSSSIDILIFNSRGMAIFGDGHVGNIYSPFRK